MSALPKATTQRVSDKLRNLSSRALIKPLAPEPRLLTALTYILIHNSGTDKSLSFFFQS